MTHAWRLILQPNPARGAWNMALDEALLESTGCGDSLPSLRLYAWAPTCLSLGYAQPFADVDFDSLAGRGWDLVRRPTGGRAILHTDELTYSVAGPADHPLLAGSVLESYNRLAQALSTALGGLGLPAAMKERVGGSAAKANPVCFEVPSTYEITVNGMKLVGSAQSRRKGGVLQHGSIPLTGDLARILEALVFPDESSRQAAADRLRVRAATVESVLGQAVSWDEAARAFIAAFQQELDMGFRSSSPTAWENRRAQELLLEKYTNPDWTRRV